jgi:FO synthase
VQVVEAAHGVGLRTTSTIMFGHVDAAPAWAAHLAALRRLASKTNGISEFVPLPFVHMQAPIYLKGALPCADPLVQPRVPHRHSSQLSIVDHCRGTTAAQQRRHC